MIRHGYYLPATNTEYGDPEFSALARALWVETQVPTPVSPSDGVLLLPEPPKPSRYCGASVFTREDGTLMRRITLVSEEMVTTVKDYP